MGSGKDRNKLCPCGSGKKVKTCHPEGLSDNEKNQLFNSFRDQTSKAFLDFYHSNIEKIENFREKKFNYYLGELVRLLGGRSSQGELASRAVRNALENIIPKNIKEKISKQNIYFWLALDRRIMPIDGITRYFENPTSIKLTKFYMNNVFYQFSSFSLDTNLAQDNHYTPDDYFVIYEVEVLAVILQKIGLLRRISSKGGKILIENGKFGASSEPELKERLLNFDEEREKLSGWQHLIGLKTTAIHPAKDGGILNDSKLLFMQINGGEIKDFEYSKEVRVLMPHCTPNVVSLAEVYSLFSIRSIF